MALTERVIDVPIAPVNQAAPRHGSPLGYLSRLKNCEVTHYVGGDGGMRMRVRQRGAFEAMTDVLRLSTTGAVDSGGSWANPEVVTEFREQLLSVCHSVPRVYNGTDFTEYAADRVVPYALSSAIRYGSNHVIAASDSRRIGNVTMMTWSETAAGPHTAAMGGLWDASGAWVRPPFEVYANTGATTRAASKIATDGVRFWAFTAHSNGSSQIIVSVFDTHGVLLDDVSITANQDGDPPVFDIIRDGAGVLFAQWDGADGVEFRRFTFALGAIVDDTNVDTTTLCTGYLGFLSNDVDTLQYLATIVSGEFANVFAYQIDELEQTHEYNMGYTIPGGSSDGPLFCSSLSGYVAENLDVFVQIALMPRGTETVGPAFDPALRYTDVQRCTFAGSSSTVKEFQSTIPQTRTFRLDDDWHSVNYYQSGSGLALDPEPIDVTITPGDVFIGATDQPIEVNPGDYTTGSPFLVNSESGTNSVYVSTAKGSWSIQAGNTVTPEIASGLTGVVDGTQVLKWEFPPETFLATNSETRLSVSGASVSAANGSWLVVNTVEAVNTIYTLPNEIGSLPSGTFTTAGTAELIALARYSVVGAELASYITSTAMLGWFAPNGEMDISGTGGPDDGVKTIRYLLMPGTLQGTYARLYSSVTTEAAYNGSFTAEISGNPVNGWHFSDTFDDSMIGSFLRVSADVQEPGNIGTFEITDTNGAFIIVDATAIRPQLFEAPVPVASIVLADPSSSLSMTLDDVDVDYSFVGAAVSYVDNNRPENSGTYRVIDVQTPHTLYLVAIDAGTGQHNSDLSDATITIVKAIAATYPFQATWIMQPLTSPGPLTGAFERGLAYGDWRVEADAGSGVHASLYPFWLASVDPGFVLPYREQSVTAQSFVVTPRGTIPIAPTSFGSSSFASTVGLKAFEFGQPGQSAPTGGALMLPGPLAAQYTQSGFAENNTVVGPEASWVVSQSESDPGVPGLTVNQPYQWVPVFEYTDRAGARSWSVPGPPLNAKLVGDNNQVTIGGRLPIPLTSSGAPAAISVGITAKLVAISLYRTGVDGDGQPTTIHYKITDDLNVNGIAPVSASNVSGFSFPDPFTWNYLDSNADALILSAEQLYTDKGYLPRYPAPPFRQAADWQNRTWLIGYDDAIWVSFEHVEGEEASFHPALRIPSPGEAPLVALGASEGLMAVFTAAETFYIPASNNLPAANGNGSLPNPQPTTFTNGCTGWTCTLQDGVAYASTAGGVWFVNRSLQNTWLSEPLRDILTDEIRGLHVDGLQRLHVVTTSTWYMFDAAVTKTWHEWPISYLGPRLGTTFGGQPVLASESGLSLYSPAARADVDHADVAHATPPDVTFQTFDFANVRGLKHVWEFQATGEYRGPHQANVELGYPDSSEPMTTFEPFTPDPDDPYVVVFNPRIEETSSFDVRIFATFTGITPPGDSFELELISAQVGVQSGGLNKLPDRFRMTSE